MTSECGGESFGGQRNEKNFGGRVDQRRLRGVQRHFQRDQVVLRAVVQIAFQPSSLLLPLDCGALPVVDQFARRGITVTTQLVGLDGPTASSLAADYGKRVPRSH